jgi:isoquinoline 1-oxidoreductase subunit beta
LRDVYADSRSDTYGGGARWRDGDRHTRRAELTVPTSAIDRREFLQGLAAGGLLLVVTATGCQRMSDALRGAQPPSGGDGNPPLKPAVYLRIAPNGDVTVVVHRSEMGQGIRTSLAMIVADELEADWSRVHIEQAPGDEKTYGGQDTDGSHSIRDFLMPMREAGATGRALLEQAAAKQWGVPVADVRAELHQVHHAGSGRVIGYAALIATARTLPVPSREQLRLKQPSEFRYIGKEIPSLDQFDMTTGRAMYGIDQRIAGMRYAVVARPPVYGGTLATMDAAAAQQVPGVERVVRLDHTPPPSGMSPVGGVAVIASSTWAAIQGRKALSITWHDGPNATHDSVEYKTALLRSARAPGGQVGRRQGNVAQALAGSARRLEADYYAPYLAHAPMEPMAALAVVRDGRCEVWAPTQDPQGARNELAKALGIPADNIRVNVTLLGGGFGRKSFPDFIIEAALLARAVGAPVKVQWTREDDIEHDFFHSVAVEHLEAGLDAHGKVIAWLHRSALPAIESTFTPNVVYQGDGGLSQGMTDLPYAIPNVQAEAGPATAHVRIGWYRSVINIPHAFAIGSFIDELAHAAQRDPKAFILDTLGPDHIVDMNNVGVTGKLSNYGATFEEYPIDTGRYRGVLELVAQRSGWGTPLPKGQGRGIAVHRSFLSYVAEVVQVQVEPDGKVIVPRVDIAIDAGFVANPERVRSQLEGGVIMGLSNALVGAITFKRGRTEQSNFDGYKILRMDAAPRDIHVHIVPSTAKPAGVGEPGVPPTAPALCNAIFAATGQRIRTLPVADQLGPHGPGRRTIAEA